MELHAPFNGWHYDDNGTLHTPCGYRTTPEQIEHALWLYGMLIFENLGKRIMFADTPQLKPRRIYELLDYDQKVHIRADRDHQSATLQGTAPDT